MSSHANPVPALLDAEQVGELLSCTAETVRRWHRQGIIPSAIHEGKTVRFDLYDVRAALRRRAKERDANRPAVDLNKLMVPTI